MGYSYSAPYIKYAVRDSITNYFKQLVGKEICLDSCEFFGNAVQYAIDTYRATVKYDCIAETEIGKFSNWRRFVIKSRELDEFATPVWNVSKVDIFEDPLEFLAEATGSLTFEALEVLFVKARANSRLGRIYRMITDEETDGYTFTEADLNAVIRAVTTDNWMKHGTLVNELRDF